MKLFPQVPPSVFPSEIEREALLGRLRTSAAPLVVLQAPVGFGKGTLAAQYVRQSARSCLWLDLRDQELRGAQLAQMVLGAQLCQEAPPYASLEGRSLADLTDLLEQVVAATTRGLNLVLTHTRGLDREGFAWISDLAERQWPEVRVLVCGHAFPHLLLRTLVHHRTALVLNADDLAFTLQELGHLSGGLAAAVPETWPLAALVRFQDEYQMPGLLSEMLGQLPPEWHSALPELVALEDWSEAQVAQLGLDLPQGWLRQLIGRGFPLSETQGGAWRPHPLFQELLRSELQRSPQRFATTFKHAAQLYESQARFDEAIRAYLHLGDIDSASKLSRHLIRTWEGSWETRRIAQTLQQFKEGTLPSDLASALALALVDSGKRLAGEALLQQHLRQPSILYALSVAAARRGDYASQLRLAEEGLALQAEPAVAQRLRRARANGLLGLGQYGTALAETNLLLEQQRTQGGASELCSLLLIKESVQAACGQYAEREVTLRQALAIASDLKLGNHEDVIQIYQAENRLFLGDHRGALGSAERLSQTLQDRGSMLLPFALELKGEAQRVLGQLQDALETFRQALAASHAFRIDGLYPRIHARQAELLAQLGFSDEASMSMTIARAAGTEYLCAPQEGVLTFYEGVCAFWQRRPEEARALFVAVLANPAVEHRYAVRSRLYLAKLLRDMGQSGDSQALLAALSGNIRKSLAPFEQSWLEADPASQVRSDPVTLAMTPNSNLMTDRLGLQIRTVGKFGLWVNDVPLRVSSSKTRELLTFLAMHGECRRETLLEALWEGSNEKRHVDHLKLLIRRLRGSLSVHPGVTFNSILYTDGYYSLAREFEIRLDVGHLLTAGDRMLSGVAEHPDLLVTTFLQGTYTEWVSQARAQFTERSLETFIALARQQEASAPIVAAGYYRRAIGLDPLLEQPYQLLIDLLLRTGEDAAAETIYRLYAKMLQEEYGTEPPSDLKARLSRPMNLH